MRVWRMGLLAGLLAGTPAGGCAHRGDVEPTPAPRRAVEPERPAATPGGEPGPVVVDPEAAGGEPAAPPPAPPAPPPAAPPPGACLLEGIHPELRRRALALYEAAQARGVAVRFISGHRTYQPRKRMGRGGLASWHHFGMAFDLNLVHRKGMREALARYAEDEEAWRTLGEIGEALGLIWGGRFRTADPFHFEWHPGLPARIGPGELRRLLDRAGPDGRRYRETWGLFEAEAATP